MSWQIFFIAFATFVAQPIPSKYVPRCVDVSMNNVYIEDSISAIRIFHPDPAMYQNDFEGYYYINRTRSELLQVYFHPGNYSNCFSEFTVMPLLKDTSKYLFARLRKVHAFISGKGIHLGLPLDSLFLILGRKHSTTTRDKDSIVVEYSLEQKQAPSFFGFYNTPSYSSRYVFRRSRLVEFHFGLDYP